MPNIEIDFNTYVPSAGIVYGYYGILKQHNFIDTKQSVLKKSVENVVQYIDEINKK